MKIISEEVRTAVASMAVVNRKILALGPARRRVVVWLHYVQDYGHPVLVIVPN